MAFLTPEEIKTHLYGEIVDTIDRADSDILQSAIDAAIAEMEGYLSAYDTDTIFSTTGADRNPILLLYCKDIAVWHFIQLANPNVDFELRADRYEKAIKWLDKIQAGKIVPDLPIPDDGNDEQSGIVKFGGVPPRTNYY